MLDTVPEHIGNSSGPGVRACHSGPGVLISKVGTVCVSSASTGLCGGQRVTAVPTAPGGPPGRPSRRVFRGAVTRLIGGPNSFRYSEVWMDLSAFDFHLPEDLI